MNRQARRRGISVATARATLTIATAAVALGVIAGVACRDDHNPLGPRFQEARPTHRRGIAIKTAVRRHATVLDAPFRVIRGSLGAHNALIGNAASQEPAAKGNVALGK